MSRNPPRLPRHRARRSPADARGPALAAVEGVLASAAAIAGACILAVLATGGSYALWSDSAAIDGGTITAGSTGLTVEGRSEYTIPSSSWSGLLPGDTASRQLRLANTGTVAGRLRAVVSDATGPFLVQLAAGACSGSTPGAATTAVELGTLAAGAETTVCLRLSLPASTPAGTQGTGAELRIDFALETGV